MSSIITKLDTKEVKIFQEKIENLPTLENFNQQKIEIDQKVKEFLQETKKMKESINDLL